jgi:mannosyltransferase OCH1-like enzyme
MILDTIYSKLNNNKPICFVRINDGEVSSIISNTHTPSRGDEISSEVMSKKLKDILTDDYHNPNLYIGIPCMLCYKNCYDFATNLITKSKKPCDFIINNIVDANILINNNYNKTLKTLISCLQDKYIVVVGNEVSIQNIDKLKKIINVTEVHIVTSKNAFNNCYIRLSQLMFKDNAVVITLCGPLGRILCYEWYKNNETLTCLDLGSFFDPLLRNKAYFYHTNNLHYCNNCFSGSYSGFSDIFKYCTEPVNKECFYLDSIEKHLQLFGNDENRIINNTKIRLENEDNILLYELMTYCKSINIINKFQLPNNINIEKNKYIIEVVKKKNPKQILYISQVVDSTLILLLENTDAYITNINNEINNELLEYINSIYKDRIYSIKYDINLINQINDIYDVIYSNHNTYLDNNIISLSHKSTNNTIVFVEHNNKHQVININKYKKFLQVTNTNIFDTYSIHTCKFIILKYIPHIDYIYVGNLLSYLVKDNKLTNKIYTHISELQLLEKVKTIDEAITEGYTFQNLELFEDIIDICKKYNFSNILEIGFLFGASSLMFLANTNANVTSIDHKCINPLFEEHLISLYPNRFKIIYDNSNNVIPTLNNIYDLIFLDGSHDFNVIYNDICNSLNIVNKDTVFILNDVVTDDKLHKCWNDGPTRILKFLSDYINIIFVNCYCEGRGIAVFTININIIYNILTKQQLLTFKNIDKDILKTTLSKFDLILTDDEYYNQLDINQLEQICSDRFTDKKIKSDTLNILKEHYLTNRVVVNIPKNIHLIYLNQKPLKDYHYKCINSVLKHMPNYNIVIHNDIEPNTPEWNSLKQNHNVNINKIDRISKYNNTIISYVQYEADILRLEMLYKYGGIYLDLDIFMVKNIDELLLSNYDFYYGRETSDSLINCVLISTPNNEIITKLLNGIEYKIDKWAWHIRDYPKLLFERYPHYIDKYNITFLDYENFCPIHWTEPHLLSDPILTEKTYGIHLYDTILGSSLHLCKLLQ